MINNINNKPTSPLYAPHTSKLHTEPKMQVDDEKTAVVLANVQSAVSFKKKESKQVLTLANAVVVPEKVKEQRRIKKSLISSIISASERPDNTF